jgi:signal transduction histidine kinase
MDCDADLQGRVQSVVCDVAEPANADLSEHNLFDIAEARAAASASAKAFPTNRSHIEESCLLEEAWISDAGPDVCDHYLEHRLMAQEYEGLRMGRELHDSTAQLLLSLRLSVAHLQNAYASGESEQILEEINETVRQIDQEIRAFSYLHYPAELGQGGLIAALNTLARGFGDRTGLKIVFKAVCDRTLANGAASVALLRVAQEALMNVHRHARAGLVRMSLIERRDTVELSVQDDGQGMPPPTSQSVSKGLGLQGMRHRVERLGGHFLVRRLKRGTKIVANLSIGGKQAKLPKADGGKTDYPYHTHQGAEGG